MLRQVMALAIVTACGAHPAQPRASGNDLLAYVPAETPYVVGGLEPFPLDALDPYMRAMGPELHKIIAKTDDESSRIWRAVDVMESFGTKQGPQLPDELKYMFGRTEMRVEMTEHGLAFRIVAERNR